MAAGQVIIIENAIKEAKNAIKQMDGVTAGQTAEDAIKLEAETIAKGIDDYMKSIIFASTPADVTAAIFVAGQIPVISTNLLQVKIIEQ